MDDTAKQRTFRFSLRTMFVITTVVAIFLAYWPFVEFNVQTIGGVERVVMTERLRDTLMVGIPVAIAWWYWRKHIHL